MALVILHPAISAQQGKAKTMEMPVVESGFLMHVSYDQENLQMTVTMKNGAQYLYSYVYPNAMSDFLEARSKGEFYSRAVKGRYESTRIITKSVGKKISQKSKTQRRTHG